MDSYDVICILEQIREAVKTDEPHKIIEMIDNEIEEIEEGMEQ